MAFIEYDNASKVVRGPEGCGAGRYGYRESAFQKPPPRGGFVLFRHLVQAGGAGDELLEKQTNHPLRRSQDQNLTLSRQTLSLKSGDAHLIQTRCRSDNRTNRRGVGET